MYIVLVPHLTTGIYSSEQNVINILIKWSRCAWRCSLSLLGLSLSYTLMLDSQEQQFLKRTKCTIFQIIAILGNGEAGKVADPDRHFCSPTSSPDYPYGWPPPQRKPCLLLCVSSIWSPKFSLTLSGHINATSMDCMQAVVIPVKPVQ